MLVDRAKELRELSAKVQRGQIAEELETRLANVLQDLDRRTSQIASEVELLTAFGQGAAPDVVERVQSLRHQVGAFRHSLPRDYQTQAFGPLRESLDSLIQEVRLANRESWNKANQALPLIPTKVVEVFRGAPLLNDWAQKMINLRSQLVEVMPSKAASLRAQLQLHEEIRQHLVQIPGKGIPRAVMDFLQSAVAGGAALEMLTPEVVDWFKTHGLLTEFVVIPQER